MARSTHKSALQDSEQKTCIKSSGYYPTLFQLPMAAASETATAVEGGHRAEMHPGSRPCRPEQLKIHVETTTDKISNDNHSDVW
jgi:hypothetical protein